MRQLKIMSMDFTPNFLLSRRMIPGQNEAMMKIASSYIQEEHSFDVVLLQGKNAYQRGIELAKRGDYHLFSEKNASSAILTKQDLPVYKDFVIPGVGNIVIIPTVYNYLSIASVSLTSKKEEERLLKTWNRFTDYDSKEIHTELQVVGGLFQSQQSLAEVANKTNLIDTAQRIQSNCDELKNDSYSILISKEMKLIDPVPHRQTGLVKEKYIKHCPIGISVQYTN